MRDSPDYALEDMEDNFRNLLLRLLDVYEDTTEDDFRAFTESVAQFGLDIKNLMEYWDTKQTKNYLKDVYGEVPE